jgi:hypothetical protein
VRGKSFYERFLIYAQIWFSLLYANRKIGFTHNDLHAGNVLIIDLEKPITIEYPETTIKTKELAKIIDFGRSFTFSADKDKKVIGRAIPSQSIRLAPNYFYDCYFILQRTLSTEELNSSEVKMFINFFSIIPSGSLYQDMRVIANKSYDVNKWLNLIFNCPSGKKLLKRNTNKHEEIQEIVLPSKEQLATDHTFEDLRKYLDKYDYRDLPIVKKQIDIEEKRINRLVSLRAILKNKEGLPIPLKFWNPDTQLESQQNYYISKTEEIIKLSESLSLTKYLENLIEIYRKRLDYLSRWTTIRSA